LFLKGRDRSLQRLNALTSKKQQTRQNDNVVPHKKKSLNLAKA
jgi:hypothetical protein